MNNFYKFALSGNSEIKFRWQSLNLAAKVTSIFPSVVEFLGKIGRMKYVRPLFRALSKCGEEGKRLARETFEKNRNFYHPICARVVAKDLGIQL